jgi:general secretion pathway protein G
LIELLLVLVILAVLAAVVVPKFTSRGKQARETAASTDLSNLETALDAFQVDTGRFPSSDEGLGALLTQPSNV